MKTQMNFDERLSECSHEMAHLFTMVKSHGINSPEFKSLKKEVNTKSRALLRESKERNGGKTPRLPRL